MIGEIFSYLKNCQRVLGIPLNDLRLPSQRKWIEMGRMAGQNVLVQDTGEDQFDIDLPLSICQSKPFAGYCTGESLSKNKARVKWNQKTIFGTSYEFGDENTCDTEGLNTFLVNAFSRKFPDIIDNLMNELDAAVFAELYPHIKASIAGINNIVLGGVTQDGMPYAHKGWDKKLKSFEKANFDSLSQWDYVGGQDALEYNSLAGGESIMFSRNVVGNELYQVKRGSYFLLQKMSLKAGFYANGTPQSWETVVSTLNRVKVEMQDSAVYRILEPSTGVIIELVVKKVSDCNSEFTKWVITPKVTYMLLVPSYEGCTYPAPHMYKYYLCGIPEPVCQNYTPSFAPQRKCLNIFNQSGCSIVGDGQTVTISAVGPVVIASGVASLPWGADVSTVQGQISAINVALGAVVGGGSVFLSANGIEYTGGSLLQEGQTYTVTLACGGTFQFSLSDCQNVLQPQNIVTQAFTAKTAFSRYTENGTSSDDILEKVTIVGKPDLLVNLPISDVSGIQAAFNTYMLAEGISGTLIYSASIGSAGNESIFIVNAVSNVQFVAVHFATNGVIGQIETFV